MSADNGIYILETPSIQKGKFEYRVAHLQAIKNYEWDDKLKDFSTDPDIHIANARNMWKDCRVFPDPQAAHREARRIAEDYHVLEYGINAIWIDRVF